MINLKTINIYVLAELLKKAMTKEHITTFY